MTLRTHPNFDTSELSPAAMSIYERLQEEEESGNIPNEYRLEWVESDGFSFAREDALPVPENESNGAAVEVDRDISNSSERQVSCVHEDSEYWVTLYHEDGESQMGILKGYGAATHANSLSEAIDAACEAMRLDDQLAVAETDTIDTQ